MTLRRDRIPFPKKTFRTPTCILPDGKIEQYRLPAGARSPERRSSSGARFAFKRRTQIKERSSIYLQANQVNQGTEP